MNNLEARRFHVIVTNPISGKKTYMTKTPVTHNEGCIILSKLTKFNWRQETLEEINETL